MKKIFEVTLGLVTSVGGFLEIGSVATAAQAGAAFGYQLGWAVLLGTLCLIFLVEQSGRFAAVSKHTIVDAFRERFGFRFFVWPLLATVVVSFLVLTAEIGGVCIALQFATGVALRVWAIPVGILASLILWKGTFGLIEKGSALLGLVTLVFVVAAWRLHPVWHDVAAGLLPRVPDHDRAQYGFIAVSILGASISPYLFYFYSSGAIEDKWNESDLGINRIIAAFGMSFGGTLSLGVLIVAALVFLPKGITVDSYDQLALLLTDPLGRWGFRLLAASIGVACLGAALEITLALGYVIAQGFGWGWKEDGHPSKYARFALVNLACPLLGALIVVAGMDPLKLTIMSMALTAVVLPMTVAPFLLLMNDAEYLGTHRNGWISNGVVMVIVTLSFVVAVVAIPLQLKGS